MRRAALALSLLVLAALGLTACGYKTGSLVSSDYRTIAVPVFDNTTRRHDLEWEVTRAVVEELQARTDLRVVDPAQNPDLVLEGTLVRVDEDVLSRLGRQRIRESTVFVTAEIRVVSGRDGSDVVSRRKVTERESFVPFVGEDVRTARQTSVHALAERIVRQLEEGW